MREGVHEIKSNTTDGGRWTMVCTCGKKWKGGSMRETFSKWMEHIA